MPNNIRPKSYLFWFNEYQRIEAMFYSEQNSARFWRRKNIEAVSRANALEDELNLLKTENLKKSLTTAK